MFRAIHCSLLSALCLLSPLPPLPASGADTPDAVRIDNAAIRIGFDSTDGRLLEPVDIESARNLVRPRTAAGTRSAAFDPGIWRLELLGGDTITPAAAHNFDIVRVGREHARAFVWGLQPTIANFLPSQLGERLAETSYMLRLARLRKSAAEFLQYGTFVRAPELHVPTVDVDLSRLSIYAARRGGPAMSKDRYPGAISAAWRSSNGDVAIAIASIVDTSITTTITIDPQAYGLAGGGRIVRLDENGARPIGAFAAAAVELPLEIPAAGALVIELKGAQ